MLAFSLYKRVVQTAIAFFLQNRVQLPIIGTVDFFCLQDSSLMEKYNDLIEKIKNHKFGDKEEATVFYFAFCACLKEKYKI